MSSTGIDRQRSQPDVIRSVERSGAPRRRRTVGIAVLTSALFAGGLVTVASPVGATPPLAPVDLGTASTYAVLSGASVANTVTGPVTTLRGDLGVTVVDTISGFPPGLVHGTKHNADTQAVQALAALVTAYNDAAGRSQTGTLAGDQIGVTFTPGVYHSGAAVSNTGILTLDAQNNADAVFIFQVNGALGMAAYAEVKLINGAQASRVFWQVNGAGTLAATAKFAGTLMAMDAISVGAGAIVNGRLLARTGAITLNSNEVYATPPVLTITGGATATTNDPTPTIAGTTDVDVGRTITATVAGQTLTTTVQTGGTWTVTASLIANGTYAVVASVTDVNGNSGTASQSLSIDTVLPVVTIVGGAAASTNDPTPTITGATDVGVGVTVTLTIAGQTLTTVVQSDGTWNVTPSTVADGTHAATASVADAAGNVGSASQSLTVDTVAPTITIAGGATALTNDATPTIGGTVTTDVVVGATVTVTIAGQTLTTTVQAGRTWSATAATVADGAHTVLASVADAAGNPGSGTQSLTVDTTAPSVTITGGGTALTNDNTPTITGTTSAATGTTVTVTIAGQTLTTLVQGGGTWNVTPATVADGTQTVVTSITEPAGNLGSATQLLTIDTAPPTIAISGGATMVTTDSSPTIVGTSDATPGTTVTVTIAGQTLTTTVQIGGTWAVTAATLVDGARNVVVTVADVAGNVRSATQSLTINTVAPPLPNLDFTTIGPKRVFDTRPGQSPNALRSVPKQKVGGVDELEVQVTNLIGYVPAAGVGAVSLNVTVTDSEGDGFLTVYACGIRESVSSLNYTTGVTVANAIIAPVSASGTVCIFSSAPTHIVADINGWFATGKAFTPVDPKRVFDTRPGQSPRALRTINKARIQAGGVLEVQLTNLAGFVPATGVGSVSLNVTTTEPSNAGFITVYDCGTRELVSSLNYVAGQTVANAVIAAVSPTGTVCFYSSATTDLVVDINGWLSASSGFTGVSPKRVLDTRAGQSPNAIRDVAKRKIGGVYMLEVRVTDLPGVVPATGVGGVSLNVVATSPEGDGYVTVFSCGTREAVSSLNYRIGQTVANAVLTPVSASGTICLYSHSPTDVIVDVNGWFSDVPSMS